MFKLTYRSFASDSFACETTNKLKVESNTKKLKQLKTLKRKNFKKSTIKTFTCRILSTGLVLYIRSILMAYQCIQI